MSGAGWWLADAASQLLERRDRDAVRGDLIESGSGGWRLVVVPALWGMRRARRGVVRLSTALWGAGALVLLTLVTAPLLEESMTLGRGFYPSDTGPDGFAGTADDPRPLWPLSIVMIWPTAYLVASAIWNREPRHHAA
jgi:hypothetical protein